MTDEQLTRYVDKHPTAMLLLCVMTLFHDSNDRVYRMSDIHKDVLFLSSKRNYSPGTSVRSLWEQNLIEFKP
jgi:hypothetical protein